MHLLSERFCCIPAGHHRVHFRASAIRPTVPDRRQSGQIGSRPTPGGSLACARANSLAVAKERPQLSHWTSGKSVFQVVIRRTGPSSRQTMCPVGQIWTQAIQPVHVSDASAIGDPTRRAGPRWEKQIADRPRTASQARMQSPQRMHFPRPLRALNRGLVTPSRSASV